MPKFNDTTPSLQTLSEREAHETLLNPIPTIRIPGLSSPPFNTGGFKSFIYSQPDLSDQESQLPEQIAQTLPTSGRGKQIPKKTHIVQTEDSCNCTRSGCLKLYCRCFSTGTLCNQNCLCRNCKNSSDNMERSIAINLIIQKDANAFSKQGLKARGKCACNCRKSGCLKKYCECFKNGVGCGSDCACFDCNNTLPTGKRRPLSRERSLVMVESPPLKKKPKVS